jgi:hypothetical protein
MEDLFKSSPFADPYPISASFLENAQPTGLAWNAEMDNILTLFVRKYNFDFSKCSKAFKAYMQNVVCDVDGDGDVDYDTLTADACR